METQNPQTANNARRQANYRVYIEQVNATYVDVKARSEEEAREKGYTKWRRDDAHSRVTYIEKLGLSPDVKNTSGVSVSQPKTNESVGMSGSEDK